MALDEDDFEVWGKRPAGASQTLSILPRSLRQGMITLADVGTSRIRRMERPTT